MRLSSSASAMVASATLVSSVWAMTLLVAIDRPSSTIAARRRSHCRDIFKEPDAAGNALLASDIFASGGRIERTPCALCSMGASRLSDGRTNFKPARSIQHWLREQRCYTLPQMATDRWHRAPSRHVSAVRSSLRSITDYHQNLSRMVHFSVSLRLVHLC